MWRLPVLHSTDPGESCRLLQFLANQGSESRERVLPRYDRKPKRLATRRLFVLQGLPGIGPELARRLLSALGSVARVMTADAATLERGPWRWPEEGGSNPGAGRRLDGPSSRRVAQSQHMRSGRRTRQRRQRSRQKRLRGVATSDIMWSLWQPWRGESASES